MVPEDGDPQAEIGRMARPAKWLDAAANDDGGW
jgi:hypothetical protein